MNNKHWPIQQQHHCLAWWYSCTGSSTKSRTPVSSHRAHVLEPRCEDKWRNVFDAFRKRMATAYGLQVSAQCVATGRKSDVAHLRTKGAPRLGVWGNAPPERHYTLHGASDASYSWATDGEPRLLESGETIWTFTTWGFASKKIVQKLINATVGVSTSWCWDCHQKATLGHVLLYKSTWAQRLLGLNGSKLFRVYYFENFARSADAYTAFLRILAGH